MYIYIAHAVAAVRVVVARVSPPSWCLISCVLHALHAVSRTSQGWPGCAAATAGAGRAAAAAVLVLQRVCVAHAAVATRVVVAHAGVVTHAGVDRRRRDGG